VQGRPFTDLVHPDDLGRIADALAACRTRGAATAHDVRLRHRDGSFPWFDVEANHLPPGSGATGILLTCHETTERRAIAQRLAQEASHDPLTGLPNRSSFAEKLEETADDGRPFAVLFIDLDHFKPVNDTYGHSAGDTVLRTVALRLRDTVRVDASRANGDLVCRLGGDEFAIVLCDVTPERACDIAERIIATVAVPVPLAHTVVHIGATVGIAMSSADGDSPLETVRHADAAMYRAKEAGRGRYDIHAH
jgi:diguanylate cyclase (GGDEF)-like protein